MLQNYTKPNQAKLALSLAQLSPSLLSLYFIHGLDIITVNSWSVCSFLLYHCVLLTVLMSCFVASSTSRLDPSITSLVFIKSFSPWWSLFTKKDYLSVELQKLTLSPGRSPGFLSKRGKCCHKFDSTQASSPHLLLARVPPRCGDYNLYLPAFIRLHSHKD